MAIRHIDSRILYCYYIAVAKDSSFLGPTFIKATNDSVSSHKFNSPQGGDKYEQMHIAKKNT